MDSFEKRVSRSKKVSKIVECVIVGGALVALLVSVYQFL